MAKKITPKPKRVAEVKSNVRHFRLLPNTGTHNYNGTLISFRDNKVLESESDLCKKFPGKFEEVTLGGPTRLKEVQQQEEPESNEPADTVEDVAGDSDLSDSD